MSKWISVKDKLPSELEEVMFFYIIYGNKIFNQHNDIAKRDIVCGHIEKGIWHICYLYSSLPLSNEVNVTHWMPLPAYPK